MSQIRVNAISGDAENTPVHFPQGLSGDGKNLLFVPEIQSITPAPGETNVSVGSNIVITFDQNIQFSVGVGTIKLRKDSVNGTVHESYATGSSGNLTISNNQLTINPSTNLSPFSTYFLEIPNVGIANTMGISYKGNGESPYKFSTENGTFSATGGSSTHITGGYKYHVFLGSGPLTFDYNTKYAGNITLMLVGGGGGGGGSAPPSPEGWGGGGGGGGGVVVQRNFTLPQGEYSIGVGNGGAGSGWGPPSEYGAHGGDTFLTRGVGHPEYAGDQSDIVYTAYGGGGGLWALPTAPLSHTDHNTLGSGGGINGFYAYNSRRGIYQKYDGYGLYGTSGQGNKGGGGQGRPFPPGSGPNTGRQTAGGGGGSGQNGYAWNPYPNPGNPTYPGSKSGYGGDGKSVPEFRWPNWGPHVPDPASGTGSNWPVWKQYVLGTPPSVSGSAITGIGPTGRYGGGGGGGSARQSNPSHPAPNSRMTAGRGGQGGGGHGFRVEAPISDFGYPVHSPTWSFRPNISAVFGSPDNYAQDGAIYTGGGGGGTTGSTPAYHAGRGGTGIAILRYPV